MIKAPNKVLWIVVIVVILIVAVSLLVRNKSNDSKVGDGVFTIGAALPMSGPAAAWGENLKNGMELALENKTNIRVIYEDTKGTPADGISAFNALQLKGVNLTVSALSAVNSALSKVALNQKVPLLATLTTADGIVNDYTIRYYNDAYIYASPAFLSSSSPVISAKKIAFIYRNDDLGTSVLSQVKDLSLKYGKDLVFVEAFKPAETDYSTILTKVKASGADVFLFTDSTALEGLGILKMAYQLGLSIPIVETSSVFSDLQNRKQVPEGMTYYSTAFNFILPGNAVDFKNEYIAKFKKEPSFGAAFGYDIINVVSGCVDQKIPILQCVRAKDQIVGISGTANQVLPGDFVVTMHLEKVN